MSEGNAGASPAGSTGEQQLVNCAQCGAPVSNVDLSQPKLYCTDCGAEVVVPEAVKARARSYVAEMQREERRLVSAERAEVQVKTYTAVVKSGRYGIWLLIWVAAIMPLSVMGLMFGLPLLGLKDQQLVGQIVYVAAIILVVGPIITIFILSRRRIHSAGLSQVTESPHPTVSAPCQACGAQIEFEPGEASKVCSYCQTANVAPTSVAEPMINWVGDNVRAVEGAREHGEREAKVALAHAVTVSNCVMRVLRTIGAIAPAAFFLTIGFSFYSDGSHRDERGALVFILLGAVWLIGLGLRALFRHSRRA